MTLGPNWPLVGAAVGFGIVLMIILVSKVSAVEAALFLPIGGLFALLMIGSAVFVIRKGAFIALDESGRGAIPSIPHLLAPRRLKRFDLGVREVAYELPWLTFDPPLDIEGAAPIDRLYVNPRSTGGGFRKIEAFVAFANDIAQRNSQREAP